MTRALADTRDVNEALQGRVRIFSDFEIQSFPRIFFADWPVPCGKSGKSLYGFAGLT